jgi:hypothetical protein
MQLRGIQILGIILVVIALVQTYIFYKKKRYNLWDFLLWIGIWITAAITFIYPGVANLVLPALTLQTSIFATLILSTIVAYVLLFIIYGSLKDVQKKVGDIAQAHAILQYDVENKYPSLVKLQTNHTHTEKSETTLSD